MGIKEGMNIWKISPPELRERILTLPRVAEVEVERALPNKLFIIFRKRFPALVPYHSYYLELASDGITGIRNNYDGELPSLTGCPRAGWTWAQKLLIRSGAK